MIPGEIVHVEFPSSDADRAQRFWSELFGWTFERAAEMDYRIARISDAFGAGLYKSDERTGYPNYYYAVENIEASAARVRELGGQAEAKSPVPGMGWFVACKDSEGNAFHLWQADMAAA
jgi:uncharacterized protein